jgi:hypothetical protein
MGWFTMVEEIGALSRYQDGRLPTGFSAFCDRENRDNNIKPYPGVSNPPYAKKAA